MPTTTATRPADLAVGTTTALKVWKGWRTALHIVDGWEYVHATGPDTDRWVEDFVAAYRRDHGRPVAVEYR